MKRLVVLGMMGQSPFGGQTWMHLHWLLGFQRRGCDVWYVEDSVAWPYDPLQNRLTDDCRYAVRHVAQCLERIGLNDRWSFRLANHPDQTWGLTPARLQELFRTCDALINLTGGTILREEHLTAPRRVYLETDPVTVEIRVARGEQFSRQMLAQHQGLLTYGENYGAPDCGVPLSGFTFRTTRQPIALDLWPMAYDPDARHFTTIGNYRQCGNDVEYQGELYHWSKHHEWEKFIDLPRSTDQSFELAVMTPHAPDRDRLQAHGWRVVSPFAMSLDIFGAYPDYIRRSRAEFTVAKDQNVRLRSGWFSERDACYLASGKPVVAQDTGFGNILPTGAGLFAVRTPEEALAAIAAINSDYRRHCDAARRIAQEYFECSAVAQRLLRDIGLE